MIPIMWLGGAVWSAWQFMMAGVCTLAVVASVDVLAVARAKRKNSAKEAPNAELGT